MIFKQLPTIISDLNKLGIALKSLDAMNISAVGVNTANLESYRTALKGLSVEQSVFALASKGATEEQIRQILVTNQATASEVEAAMAKAGLTTATKALNAEELIALATKKGISDERAKEIAGALGLIATEKGQVVVKKQVTLAMLEQAVASGTLTKAEASQIATMLGLTAAEGGAIVGTNLLTAAFAKLNRVISSNPWLFVIGAALTAIIASYEIAKKKAEDAEEAIKEAHEEAKQALEDTKTSLSDDKSELQSVNSELETTKERLKEISSIGAPTLTEQNELTKLSIANAQLEAQQQLLENNIKLKQKAAALDAKELLGTQVEMEYSDILDNSSIVSKKESYTYAEHAEYQASKLRDAYDIYMNALKNGDIKRQQLAQELISASGGDSADFTSALLEIVESFKYDDGTIIEGYEDIYNEYMGMIYNLQSLTNPDTFLEIAKSVTTGTNINYEKSISEAYALAYEGNFDVDNLNQDFVKALADAGIDKSTIDYIFILKQQEYQSIIDSINQKYNPENVLLSTYLVAQGHVDTPEETQEKELDRQNYEKQKQEIQAINDRLTEYARKNPIEFQLVSSYDEGFTLLDKYIEEEKNKAEKNTDYVGDYITNAIARIYDEAKVQSSTLNNETDIQFSDIFALKNSDDSLTELGKINEELDNLQSAYTDLKSVMDSYNETGYFTLDQVQEIISHGEEYLKYLVDENGQLQLNEEALNNVAIARINEMRAKVLSNLMDKLENITNETDALNYLSTQLYETADSYDDFTASRIQAWSVKALDEYGMDQTVVDGVVKSFTNIVSAANEMFDNLNIDSFGKSLDKAGSKAETDWKKLLDAELNLLDKQLEAGLISFNDYINKRKGLIEDYYNDGKIAADEYYTYLEEHYKKELSYMDKVINAVTRKIDKEIKGLKEQQDAIKERYQLEIDKLNEQKKLIEEANAERQRQIDLQKALYELERAQNQRTTLMYSEEKGMHYVANSGAIRDAQNNLEDKEYEIKISEIEKSIEKLEEARDRELEAIDEMIERLEEYKEYWNEISSEYENQQEELLAAQILGQDWEKQILDQRLDTLEKFKDRYIELQQAIADAAYEAAKARGEEAERTIIGDSSARKPGDDPKIKGWEVVNEDGGESEGFYNTEEEAKAEAQLLNKRKAKSYGMSLEEFLDSNIPKYYVLKKYHTGLKQGLVDSHTFDDDFKLVQKVGLGQDEVPAILQKNEAVITPDQISNLANGLRNYTLPEYITPLSLDDSFLNTLIFDNNIAKKMNESMSKLANSISNKTTGVNEIKQEFYITLPNVTDNTAAITLMRDLESLATKKLHEF